MVSTEPGGLLPPAHLLYASLRERTRKDQWGASVSGSGSMRTRITGVGSKNNSMAKILGLCKLCLDLGFVTLHEIGSHRMDDSRGHSIYCFNTLIVVLRAHCRVGGGSL